MRVATALLLIGACTLAGRANPVVAMNVTGAFYAAGGGAGSFSTMRAFESMLGSGTLQTEMQKLRAQFGDQDTNAFVSMFDFTMADAWQRAGADNVAIHSGSDLTGSDLANALVAAGMIGDQFSSAKFFDMLFTPKVHHDVEHDIETRYGGHASAKFHGIVNQFFTDISHQVGM